MARYKDVYHKIKASDSLKYRASDSQNKKRYSRLYRSQLSDYEILLLMYNAMTDQGGKLGIYLRQFEILDNLPEQSLLQETDENLYRSLVNQKE